MLMLQQVQVGDVVVDGARQQVRVGDVVIDGAQVPSPVMGEVAVAAAQAEPAWVGDAAMAAIIGFFVIMFPLVRALARRLGGAPRPAPELQAEIDQLHVRLAEMDQLRLELGDVQERLDFAERLLAQHRPSQLPPGA